MSAVREKRTLWRAAQPLVLASQSQTRRRLLDAVGVPFAAIAADLDERGLSEEFLRKGDDAKTIAAALARAKAMQVAQTQCGSIVLGTDQTLSCGGRLFSKPADRQQARDQLRMLSGRHHYLHSAVSVVRDGKILFEITCDACLDVRILSDAFIDLYLEKVGPDACTSVGAYQMEGLGMTLFERVEGEYAVILGLPLVDLLRFFRQQEWLLS